jgi:hypothetical protein
MIDLSFELTAMHDGYFSLQICDDVANETEECFWRRNFLPLGNGADNLQVNVTGTMGLVNTKATLPSDLTCDHCVLRVYYRTGGLLETSIFSTCNDAT